MDNDTALKSCYSFEANESRYSTMDLKKGLKEKGLWRDVMKTWPSNKLLALAALDAVLGIRKNEGFPPDVYLDMLAQDLAIFQVPSKTALRGSGVGFRLGLGSWDLCKTILGRSKAYEHIVTSRATVVSQPRELLFQTNFDEAIQSGGG